MMRLGDSLALALLEQLPDPVAVLDAREPGLPVVLVNGALEALVGQPRAELCRIGLAGLLGEPPDAPRVSEIVAQLVLGEGFSVSLQTGTHTQGLPASIRFEPLRDGSGAVTHFVSFHEVAMAPPPEMPALPTDDTATAPKPPVPREDRLTGLRHIELFHELFRRDFAIAQREGRSLTLFLCDIDALGVYNDTFGRQAGDSVIRRVGRALWSGLRRASDLLARVEEGRFVGFSVGMSADEALKHGQTLVTRVRDLHMHHPRSPVGRVVTVSVGVASVLPEPATSPEHLLKLGQQALEHARFLGRDRAAGPPETSESVGDGW